MCTKNILQKTSFNGKFLRKKGYSSEAIRNLDTK